MREEEWDMKCRWEDYCENDDSDVTGTCTCRADMTMNTETGNSNFGMCECTEGKVWVHDRSRCEFSLEEECPEQWKERSNECFVYSSECEDRNCEICEWKKGRNDETTMDAWEEKHCK